MPAKAWGRQSCLGCRIGFGVADCGRSSDNDQSIFASTINFTLRHPIVCIQIQRYTSYQGRTTSNSPHVSFLIGRVARGGPLSHHSWLGFLLRVLLQSRPARPLGPIRFQPVLCRHLTSPANAQPTMAAPGGGQLGPAHTGHCVFHLVALSYCVCVSAIYLLNSYFR